MNPFLVHQRIGHRRTWGQRLVLSVNLMLIATCFLLATSLGYGARRAASVNRVAVDRSLTALPTAAPGDRVMNILLVGSDSAANLDPDDPIQIGRHGERSGDAIIVAHLDERDGSVSLLSLPRDLWVADAGGDRQERINRAFLLGGPAALIDTIEENFQIPIHHYVNVDFAGFQGLVEAVGTVEVYFDAPARDWNLNGNPPRSQTGFLASEPGCRSLDPVQALAYVRSRYYQVQDAEGHWTTDPSSDLGRIRRQQDFLRRLVHKAIALGARNPLVLKDLIDTAITNVAIDGQLTPGLLLDLGGTYRNFDPADLQSYTVPVEDATVGARKVLVPRLDDAQPVLNLFRGAATDDPATVGVKVIYDATLAVDDPSGVLPAPVTAVIAALDERGFDVGGVDAPAAGAAPTAVPVSSEVKPGLQLRYGSGGRAVAELVARQIESAAQPPSSSPRTPTPISLVEVPGLAARQVIVAVGREQTRPSSSTSGPAVPPEGERPPPATKPAPGAVKPAGEDGQSRPVAESCR
jgi:LCP family protein required for cell wall assembly